MEFGLATIERKRIIISQLYKRIELGRGYVVNFEVDWNYKQFIDTLQVIKGVVDNEKSNASNLDSYIINSNKFMRHKCLRRDNGKY